MELKIGKRYKIYYGASNINNKIVSILTIVDKEMIVYKWFGKNTKRWYYEVKHKSYFDFAEKYIKYYGK